MCCCAACRIDVSVPGGARKPAGDGDWELRDVPDAVGEVQRGRMPPWVAALFVQQQQAAAVDVTPAAGAGVGAGAATTSGHKAEGGGPAQGAKEEVSSPAGSQPAPVEPAVAAQAYPSSAAEAAIAAIKQEAAAAAFGAGPSGTQPPASAHLGEQQQPVRPEPAPVQLQQPAGTTTAAIGAATEVPTSTHAGVNGSTSGAEHLAGSAPSAVPWIGSSTQHKGQHSLLQLLPPDGTTSDSNSSCSSHGDRGTDSQHPACTASTHPAPAAAHRSFQGPAFCSINSQFSSWVGCLYPNKSENSHNTAKVEAVRKVLEARARSQLWSVAAVYPVGSHERKTSLRGS
jgi:hypothetical protein